MLLVIGCFFCLAGLLLNEYSLAWLFTAQGSFQSPPLRLAIWLVDLLLVAWGIVTLLFRRKQFVSNYNLALLTLIIMTPLAGELFLRSAIALHVDFFRNPRLYAGWLDDDDHWKLHYLWAEAPATLTDFTVDPLLGWSPRKSPENPLGILAEAPYTPDFGQKTILFYGDSFVYGVPPVPVSKRIPQQLGQQLPDYQVYNYGVLGYGVDQIFLRFKETHGQFQKPFIIAGILTLDLDRSILTVYDAPKPYFVLEGGQLALKGVPLPQDIAGWYQQHPPGLKSYLAAFLVRQGRVAANGFNQLEMPYKQAEKKQLNSKIIESIAAEAQIHHLPLLVVIFYSPFEFDSQGWREQFLKELLTRLHVPYLDTKEILLCEARERGLNFIGFYEGGHLNELGSQVVSEAIAATLAKMLPVPAQSKPGNCFPGHSQ